MLIMFKVKNYASFKNEAVLDMRATSYIQHPSHEIPVDEKLCLLKTAAIFGANASGKSNLILAMDFFGQYILSQLMNREKENLLNSKQLKKKVIPFLLDSDVKKASEFEITFLNNDKQFRYGFECDSDIVYSEWLFIDDKKVFERTGTKIIFGRLYQKILGAYKTVPAERLYIAVLDYFLDRADKKVILDDFISFFTDAYTVFAETTFEAGNYDMCDQWLCFDEIAENQVLKRQVEKCLQMLDTGISRIEVETKDRIDVHTGRTKKVYLLSIVHNVYDDNGNVTGEKILGMNHESTGVIRFIVYIQNTVRMILNGGVLVIDEMSARLHHMAEKLMTDIFCSNQNKKAQLIFTTNDVSLLNNNQFRRDEVMFIEKNRRGESKLYALSDLKVREDATFGKDYLQGKYGAVPDIDFKKMKKI